MTNENPPTGSLQVRVRNGIPRFIAHWRFGRDQHQATLGKAWLIDNGQGGWKKKRGKAPEEFLTRDQAIVKKAEVIQQAARDQIIRTDRRSATFAHVAEDWLDYLKHSGRAKPSTLTDYGLMLSQPVPRIRGDGKRDARIMKEFGNKRVRAIATPDIDVFLSGLDRQGMSARSVNKHRQILHSVFEYARKPGTYGLGRNPASPTEKRSERNREGGLLELEIFTTEEIQAIVRAAENGKLRTEPGEQYGPETKAEWERLNRQDAALFLVAAQTGLRRGEICALKWRDVDITKRKLTVSRAVSGRQIQTPKSGKRRTVGLPVEAARKLDQQSQRKRHTRQEDYVFCATSGDFMDGRQIGLRFKRAQESAGVRYRSFHALRHTFGSDLVAKGFSLRDVQTLMGHSSITTTERYLHSADLTDLANRMSEAFEPDKIAPHPALPKP